MAKLGILILAAKAVGIPHVDYAGSGYDGEVGLEMIDSIGFGAGMWDPLTDSDDAFQLAADLQISVRHFPACVEVEYPKIGLPVELIGAPPLFGDVSSGQSRASVARMLIVQAAANLGKYKG
jgi:hypothetical protein